MTDAAGTPPQVIYMEAVGACVLLHGEHSAYVTRVRTLALRSRWAVYVGGSRQPCTYPDNHSGYGKAFDYACLCLLRKEGNMISPSLARYEVAKVVYRSEADEQ